MKQFLFIAVLLFVTGLTFGQQNESPDKKEIKKLLTSFTECLVKKDSVAFYTLFYDGPVTWAGIYKEKSQQKRVEKNSKSISYFTDNYKTFMRSFYGKRVGAEKYYNADIIEDGSIGTVIFDYSFWSDGKRTNWGKESWGLLKINGEWKITSVIFSMELEKYYPEPERGQNKQE